MRTFNHGLQVQHILVMSCTSQETWSMMPGPAGVKRAIFIENSIAICQMFWFAHPAQVLQAVNVYSCHLYGYMLWNRYGPGAGQVFRSWNTCVKLAWVVPRCSHNYFLEHILAQGVPPVRRKVLGQYLGFFGKLLISDSPEIRILVNLVGCATNEF